jgi:hypothetical protein
MRRWDAVTICDRTRSGGRPNPPMQPTPLRGPKIVAILKVGFGPIAFPIERCG